MKKLYYNGEVYTGALPLVQAFATEDGKFIFSGSDEEGFALGCDEAEDLGGAFVCAGFTDSHMHLLNFGQALSAAPLHLHTGSLEDLISCFSLHLKKNKSPWLVGRGWNQDYFSDVSRMPNRYDLDRVTTAIPVCAVRACGHALSVNSKALELLGITADTPSPEGGQIVMENGEPNGVFFDNAMDMVYSAIPAPSKEEIKDMLSAACRELNKYGITSSHSDDYSVFRNVSWQVINEAYRELEEEGALTVRVYEQANFTDLSALREFTDAGNNTGTGTDFFKIGPLKMLGDGALGARTAFLSVPYADAPETCGIPVFTQQTFDELICHANNCGMQAAIHAIGDACLDRVLASFEKALSENPRDDHRHGIVHCQITRPDQLEKIAKLKLHVYAQSIFLDYDINMVYDRVGNTLAETSYNWKTLSDNGVTVSNGSDCPVELPNVLGGIQCAVTRCTLKGRGPYLESQKFSVSQAIDSFTSMGAYAAFEENVKGKILPGYFADFVVLGKNPFTEDRFNIGSIPVKATYTAGRRVF